MGISGGFQNAFAGEEFVLVCEAIPDTVDITLEAGQDIEIQKEISCILESPFYFAVDSFQVGFEDMCDFGLGVNLFSNFVDVENLTEEFDELIQVSNEAIPG